MRAWQKFVILMAAVVATACGTTEKGVVVSRTHVPAGTPSSAGGVHEEAFYVRCKGVKSGKLRDIKVNAVEFERTNIGDSCDLNRGK